MIHFSCNTTSVLIWIRVWTEKPWNDAAHANRKLRHKYYTKFAIFHTWCNDSSLWSDSQNNGPVSSYIDKQHSAGEQLWSQIGGWAQQNFFHLFLHVLRPRFFVPIGISIFPNWETSSNTLKKYSASKIVLTLHCSAVHCFNKLAFILEFEMFFLITITLFLTVARSQHFLKQNTNT